MKYRLKVTTGSSKTHKEMRQWITGQGLQRGKTFYMSKPRPAGFPQPHVNFYVDLDDDQVATMLSITFSEYLRA